jgi:tetratricopeptide (TPR) repeat protein
MAKPRSIVESPEAALAELTAHTRPTWLARSASLPFGELYGDEFEVFCYLLVSAERPGRRVIYYGKTADGGRDIIAETEDDRVELVQCKCFNRTIDASVVREDLAKVFTNLHLGIIPQRPNRVVFYAAPGLSAEANDLLTVQGKWLDVCEEALRAHWTKRKLAQAHGPFPQALLDFARTWWPETDVVPGVKLTEWAERHPRLIEQFFALQKVVDNSAVEALRDQLLPQNLDRLWNYDEQALGKADALFDEGKYVEAAGILEALIEELGEDIALESRIRRTRARLNLTACWVNLRDHDKAKAVLRWIRSDDIDRSDRGTQLRYARMRLMLDSKADVSRWLDGDDARPLRQTKAILEGGSPEEPIEHPDVLLLAAGTALFDGRLNDVVRFSTGALDVTEGVGLVRAQAVEFLARALHQTMVEGGSDLVPIEERGPLLERIERELSRFQGPLHHPTDRVIALARAIYAGLALLTPIAVPLAEEGGKALPVAVWFPRFLEVLDDPDPLPGLESLAQEFPGRAVIESALADLLIQASRLGEGIQHAREALRLLPCHRQRFHLARALTLAGRIREAWQIAQGLPVEPERAFRVLVARLVVALPPLGGFLLDQRLALVERLRATDPIEPLFRLASGFIRATHGHFAAAADEVWKEAEAIWQAGGELPVPLLKEVKKLQSYAEQRGRRWKELARRLLPLRADPVAESLYVELYYDLEQPADLPHPDLRKLVDAGYARFTQAEDILTLIKLSGQVRELWSKGDLPAELPDLKGIPSAFELVDEITQGRLRWSAPVELLPLGESRAVGGCLPRSASA